MKMRHHMHFLILLTGEFEDSLICKQVCKISSSGHSIKNFSLFFSTSDGVCPKKRGCLDVKCLFKKSTAFLAFIFSAYDCVWFLSSLI